MRSGTDKVVWHPMPRGISTVGDLLFFGAAMASFDFLQGRVAFTLATAPLFYLVRPAVRAVFNGVILP